MSIAEDINSVALILQPIICEEFLGLLLNITLEISVYDKQTYHNYIQILESSSLKALIFTNKGKLHVNDIRPSNSFQKSSDLKNTIYSM